MNILVVTPVFSIAGVPLAQLRFARALSRRGHAVTFLIGHIDVGQPVPELPEVRVLQLAQKRVRGMFPAICRYLREQKPDVVFSAEDHLNSFVLMAAILTRSGARISCSSRVTPFDTYSNVPLTKRWLLKQVMRAVMWRADVLTCVSIDMVDQYRKVFRKSRHVCVYNIVDDAESRRRMCEDFSHDWLRDYKGAVLVAAGRLAPWKGFADLVHAMSIVREHREARLLILGDGPLRANLEELIEQLGLKDSVRLEGYVENPLKYFAQSDVFVLSSLVEGLPNVLVEAMLCGCSPVSTDCPTGPREVLQGGRIGRLVAVQDAKALAAGIISALDAPESSQSLQIAIRPFEETAVIDRHFRLLGLKSDAPLSKVVT